jgi:thiamine biosynthesis lipoprotein
MRSTSRIVYEFRAMNTKILLAGEGEAADVEVGFSQARQFIEDSEKRFTRFSRESELSQLNRSSGSWFEASPDLFEVVSLALRLHLQTAGLFDPSILEALEQAGYDRSMDEIRLYGAGAPTVLARPRLNYFDQVRLDSERCCISLPAEMRIDLGGIAKSWIAEKAALCLSRYTSSCAVDAGGDMFFVGQPEGESSWRVTLEDPLDPAQDLAALLVPPGAVATSSVTRRRWKQGSIDRHHLIDPRTQQPAETEWLSVTVAAPHAAEAEVFAKSLLIGGSGEVDRITNLDPGMAFIAVDYQKKLFGSKNSREIIDVDKSFSR